MIYMNMKMSVKEAIVAVSKKHAGVVTTRDMQELGFGPSALRQWADRHGGVTKLGRGIYTFDDIIENYEIDTADMNWFVDMAIAGPGSYFAGSTVLSFYNLGLLMPFRSYMRSPSRNPGTVGRTLVIERPEPDDQVDIIRGVRLQRLGQAFLLARDVALDKRLTDAAEQAWDRNLITGEEYDMIVKAVKDGKIRLPEIGRVA